MTSSPDSSAAAAHEPAPGPGSPTPSSAHVPHAPDHAASPELPGSSGTAGSPGPSPEHGPGSPTPSSAQVPHAPDHAASPELPGSSGTAGSPSPSPEHGPDAGPVPLSRNRDYRLLLTGSTVSELGNGMMSLAFMLLTVALTGSPARAGLVSACYMGGMWVLTLPAGALCDRWNRKRVMVTTAILGCLVMATIPVAEVAGVLTTAQLMVVAASIGALSCFYGPAESASLKRIVPAEQMGHALSLNQARSSLGLVIGSPAAAALFGLWRVAPMAVNSVCYAVAAVCAGWVRTALPAPSSETVTMRSTARDVVTGLRWVWRATAVRDMTLAGMVINLGLNGLFSTSILALQVAGTTPAALGVLDSVVGVAGLCAALAAPHVLRRVRIGAVTVAGMGFIAVVAWLTPLHLSVWWLGAALILVELPLAPLNAGIGAYRIQVTPDAMQARSLAAARFVSMAMMPLASASAGFLLEHAGRVPALVCFATVFTLGALGCAASRPIRSMPRADALAEVPEVEV